MNKRVGVARALVLVVSLLPIASTSLVPQARSVPTRLSDETFWTLSTGFSEHGGFFPSNNWVSNETLYQHVVPRLTARIKPGGVYVGVGPDQNFTYLLALKPSLAFIVDIRRQNLLHHLLYKALMELSPTRAEFVAKLFGRPKPRDLADGAAPDALMAAFIATSPSSEYIAQTTDAVLDRLTRHHGFALSEDDRATLLMVYQAFYANGPEITYSGVSSFVSVVGNQTVRWRMSPFPSYADLAGMTDADGINHGYLANETNYKALRDMQLRNAIIPIVGDFAGPKALRSVGKWVKDRGGLVTTFYTSNVEQYLFQNRVWKEYYDNIASMPLDDSSTFIRSYFGSGASYGVLSRGTPPTMPGGAPVPGVRTVPNQSFISSLQLLCPVRDLLAAITADKIFEYEDVIHMSR